MESLNCTNRMNHNTLRSFFVITFMLIGSFFAFPYDIEIDGMCYDINTDGNTVSLKKCTDFNSGNVDIPNTITYNGITYAVTSIGDNAFYCSDILTSVGIPNSVLFIGKYAFGFCKKLKSIDN